MDKVTKHPLTIWLKYGPDNDIKRLYRTFIFTYVKLLLRYLPLLVKHLNKFDNWSKR